MDNKLIWKIYIEIKQAYQQSKTPTGHRKPQVKESCLSLKGKNEGDRQLFNILLSLQDLYLTYYQNDLACKIRHKKKTLYLESQDINTLKVTAMCQALQLGTAFRSEIPVN